MVIGEHDVVYHLTRPSRLPAALAAPPADPQGRSTKKGLQTSDSVRLDRSDWPLAVGD
jgi:hypothetical protein